MKPLCILIILLLPTGNIMNEKIPQRNCKIRPPWSNIWYVTWYPQSVLLITALDTKLAEFITLNEFDKVLNPHYIFAKGVIPATQPQRVVFKFQSHKTTANQFDKQSYRVCSGKKSYTVIIQFTYYQNKIILQNKFCLLLFQSYQ